MTKRGSRATGGHPVGAAGGDFTDDRKHAPNSTISANDLVSIADRDWFAAHPGRKFRLRPVDPGEIPAVVADPKPGLARYTLVKQLAPGARTRTVFTAPPFHRPENFSDNACAEVSRWLNEECDQIAEVEKALKTLAVRP